MPTRPRISASQAVGLLGAALVAAVAAVGVMAAVRLMDSTAQDAYHDAENTSVAVAAHAAQCLHGAIFITDNLMDQLPLSGQDAESFRTEAGSRTIHEALRARERSSPSIDAVSIFDVRGRMVSTSRRFPSGELDISDREAFGIAWRGRRTPYVTAPVRSRSTGEWTFYIGRRLESDTGQFVGVLVVGLASSYFARFYEELGGADSISLARSDGAVLAHVPFDEKRPLVRLSDVPLPLVEHVQPPPSSLASVMRAATGASADGASRRQVSIRQAEGLPVFAAVAIDEGRYLQQWRSGVWSIAVVMLLAAAFLGAAFISTTRLLRKREAEMAENQKLKETADRSNRAKSEFLATMSHELRTPLNGLLGTADLLAGTRLDRGQVELVGTLTTSGRVLLGIIDDILDLSKIEAGELRLSSDSFSPSQLATSVRDLFENFAANKGLALELEIRPAIPDCVSGDAQRIQQVLVNLVSNAIKFSDVGRVCISVAASPADAREATLRFQVDDTGCGIPATDRERIFQPFTQADGSVSRRFGGTGLGLTISRRLVEMMGGRIDFRSEVGIGSSFWFEVTLPVAECPVKSELPPSQQAQARFANSGTAALSPAPEAVHQGRHVLVVEDDAINGMIAEAQLNQLGCSCVIAFDGEDALAQLAAERFDLVLMDCMLPGMSGYDVTRAWRAREAREGLGRLPIVALTANALSSNVEQCRLAGMDDFLTKPCTVDKLARTLGRWLSPVQRARA